MNTEQHQPPSAVPENSTNPDPERRSLPRYPGTEFLYGFLGPEAPILGTVQDVSPDGIRLQYLLFPDAKLPGENGNELDLRLFRLGNVFSLSNLKCRLTYDHGLAKHRASLDHLTQSRQCGLQFVGLTAEQKAAITELIQKHTSGSALS